VILQAVTAGALLLVWLALALWGSARIAALLMATLLWGIPLTIFMVAAFGLLIRATWSWTLSVIANCVAVILACRFTCEEGTIENFVAIAWFGAPPLVLVLPNVPRYFRPVVEKGFPHTSPRSPGLYSPFPPLSILRT